LFIKVVNAGSYIADEKYRWPSGVVPYRLNHELSDEVKREVSRAIDHWNSNTRFILRSKNSGDTDWIEFVPKSSTDSCSSKVGRQGGKQEIHCSIGSWELIVHEIGHAVGLYHEQSRKDRDEYVKINWHNIRSSVSRIYMGPIAGWREYTYYPDRHNFEIESSSEAFGNYDFQSIMHYRRNSFRYWSEPSYWKRKITSRFHCNKETGTIKGSEWVSNCFYCVQTAEEGLSVYKDFFLNKLPITRKYFS